jgi:ribosomal protein S20
MVLVVVAMLCVSLFTSRFLDWLLLQQGGVPPVFGVGEVGVTSRLPQLEWQMSEPQHTALEMQITTVRSSQAEEVGRIRALEEELRGLQGLEARAEVRARLKQLELAVEQGREAAEEAAMRAEAAVDAARWKGGMAAEQVAGEAVVFAEQRRAADAKLVVLEGKLVSLTRQQQADTEQRGVLLAVGERVASLERSLVVLSAKRVERGQRGELSKETVPGIEQVHNNICIHARAHACIHTHRHAHTHTHTHTHAHAHAHAHVHVHEHSLSQEVRQLESRLQALTTQFQGLTGDATAVPCSIIIIGWCLY